jgi:putative Mg2+ transporter-C (MgtC) family protein
VQIDPLRLMKAVVAGVSFIVPARLVRSRGHYTVTGVTTAASLLAAVIIGAAAGSHYCLLALSATILTLLVLTALKLLEKWLDTKSTKD